MISLKTSHFLFTAVAAATLIWGLANESAAASASLSLKPLAKCTAPSVPPPQSWIRGRWGDTLGLRFLKGDLNGDGFCDYLRLLEGTNTTVVRLEPSLANFILFGTRSSWSPLKSKVPSRSTFLSNGEPSGIYDGSTPAVYLHSLQVVYRSTSPSPYLVSTGGYLGGTRFSDAASIESKDIKVLFWSKVEQAFKLASAAEQQQVARFIVEAACKTPRKFSSPDELFLYCPESRRPPPID